MKQKIAMMGGTFNPIHLGHTEVARTAIFNLGYDRVIIIPNNIPPLKDCSDVASGKDRLEMIRLALNDYSCLMSVDDYELGINSVSYTIDTIKHLYEVQDIEGRLGLIIGTDQANQFERWKNYEEILSLVDVIIARRGKEEINFKYPYKQLNNVELNISSTEIRRRPTSFNNIMNINSDVLRYITKNHLYGV